MANREIVAHVCVTSGLGGLELYSMQLHQMFKKDGYPSIHFCQKDSPFQKRLEQEGLDYIALPKTSYFSPSTILKVRKEIKARNIKKIYIHHLKDLWFLVPAVYNLPDVEIVGFAQMFIKDISKKDFLHSILYNRMKTLITLTDIQQAELKKCLPLETDRYLTIPNSVDMSKFQELGDSRLSFREKLGYVETNQVIGVLGRLDPWKGQKELLEAFLKIAPTHPEARLLIIGEETPGEEGYKHQLEVLIDQSEFSDRIKMIGFQKNVHQWLAAMDLFVMPSYEEAFGIVLIEAMAAGLPVVSTKAGGVPDIIISDEVGRMVQPRSSAELSVVLSELLSDSNLMSKLGAQAKQYSHEKYDLNKVYGLVKQTQALS